ncbi:MAG TPA: bifunctional phosphopantothenoylcysteine decarboxylase/phosphopantothenate--cysteine ligase CoaBC [bacterium]|jgi:phosphopantothenoylcysteine decarboxylase/phosphopantothenate--cysteine ligase|nr:bifunctional phosphopantothenoylcysteine decarboxylase/phosphopantothenate--cysteine ligase CoaBC [bacterium]
MTQASHKPRVLLGITGSVAAYKAVDLIQKLKPFAEVKVVLTEAGSKLVPLKALEKASGSPVWTSLFKGSTPIAPGTPGGSHPLAVVPHIEYAKSANLVLIAPTTADFLAKLSMGMADDLLSTLCLYATCPIWVAPAMNVKMWNHPAVVQNAATLRSRGVQFLGPESGHLACGEVGDGRFAEPSEIAGQVQSYFENFNRWAGKKVLVTAGPTQEPIDPVRVISNHSSGKMGYALAQAALNRGAEVVLVTGPTRLAPPVGVKVIKIKTANEMHRQVMKFLPQMNVLVMAAAVADYRVKSVSPIKIKKSQDELLLKLVKNSDILGDVLKKRKSAQKVVGFAAETDHLRENALAKWRRKPSDLLVANQVGGKQSAFENDQNELLVFSQKRAKPVILKKNFKSRLAEEILDLLDE